MILPGTSGRLWLGFVFFGCRTRTIHGVVSTGLLSDGVAKPADEGGWALSVGIGRRKGHVFGWRCADGVGSLRGGGGEVLREGEMMRHGLLLVLVLVLIRVVGGVQGKSRVDLWGTRREHGRLWNAVVLVMHGQDEVELAGLVEVVLRITGGG